MKFIRHGADYFLQSVVNLGYKFRYVTTDVDDRYINAINSSCDANSVQVCLWNVKKEYLWEVKEGKGV